MNQLIREHPNVPETFNAFQVGHSVNSETEDVGMFIVPDCAARVPGTTTLYLDSPGLFAPNRLPIFDASAGGAQSRLQCRPL